MSFTERVLAVIKSIPAGSVKSYKQVATEAGSPDASRAVGTICKNNYNPEVPCHRVIRSDGSFGSYNRGNSLKIEILASEGFHG